VTCQNCRIESRPNAAYCDSCGEKLSDPPQSTPAPAGKSQPVPIIAKVVFGLAVLSVGLIIIFTLLSGPKMKTTATILPTPEPTEQEKLERGCKVVHFLYDDRPMSKLSLNDVKALNACRALGY
jgi:hypothetical protein